MRGCAAAHGREPDGAQKLHYQALVGGAVEVGTKCAQAATTFSFSAAAFDSRPAAQIFGRTSLAAARDDAMVRIKM